jgi:secreted Zn-dependent insulinase-like peptidase
LVQAFFVMALLHNVEPLAGDVFKSSNDKLEYKAITLDSGLRALLISDADTDKAAAALDVSTTTRRQTG